MTTITQNWHEQYQRQLADNIKLNDALGKEHQIRLKYERAMQEIQAVVDAQAEDFGLWFIAHTAAEAYLQQELRQLHAVIEQNGSSVGATQTAAEEVGIALRIDIQRRLLRQMWQAYQEQQEKIQELLCKPMKTGTAP